MKPIRTRRVNHGCLIHLERPWVIYGCKAAARATIRCCARQQLAKNIFEMHLMPTTPLQVGQLQQQLALHALTEAQLKAEYRARVQQLAEAADRRAAAERDLEERVEGLEAELSEARGRAAAVEQQLAHVELKSGRLEEER